MRDLTGPTQGTAIRGLLQGLLVAEVLAPSTPLWLLSGWVSDIPVIDNRARQFTALDSEWPCALLPLSQVFRSILSRGGGLNIVLRDVAHNYAFVDRLKGLGQQYPGSVRLALKREFHEKGIVARDFDISGSMNFTHSGIEVNDEHLIFRTERQFVAKRRLELAGLWDSQLRVLD